MMDMFHMNLCVSLHLDLGHHILNYLGFGPQLNRSHPSVSSSVGLGQLGSGWKPNPLFDEHDKVMG